MDSNALAHGIQLSVAPVFMLTAVAGLIGALAQRLARIIDRARDLEDRFAASDATIQHQINGELRGLRRRGRVVNWSIGLLTLCAILVCITIAALFVEEISTIRSSRVVPGFFLAGLACFAAALGCFLYEVMLATAALRFGRRLQPTHRDREND